MYEKIILICIGALISVLTSIVNKCMENWMKNKGDINIYRKLVYQNESDYISFGIYDNSGEISMYIPMWIEIQNTKEVSTIVRDFSVALYKKGKRVKKVKQITCQEGGKLIYYGDNGRYSFIIPPESIKSYDLLFVLKKKEYPDDFDEIKIDYYDYKNKLITKTLKSIDSSWCPHQFGVDEDWIKLN